MSGSFFHKPVMLNECIDGLNIKENGIYVDATLGAGGHSEQILKRLGKGGRLIAIDRDDDALNASKQRLSEYGGLFLPQKGNFRDVDLILGSLGIDGIDGILFDFGVSSPQLDHADRGFSFMSDAPLDMRMDRSQALTAYEIINRWDRSVLKKIFYEFGEERFSALIAAAIERERSRKPIETTQELAEIVSAAIPAKNRVNEKHPEKRVFQAVRIAVNDELSAITEAIPKAVELLKPGGRIAAISFHSLEDRIVKNAFAVFFKGCICPPELPVCVCGGKPKLKALSKKPVCASAEELAENPRSRSAKLRIAEKI